MPGCVLRIGGAAFDVDAFLRDSTFAPVAVFHRGEPHHRTAGFNVVVSDADEVPAQVIDAIAFLRRHGNELARARAFAGVEHMTLDFATHARNAAVQSERFPAVLLLAAGMARIDVELSLYP